MSKPRQFDSELATTILTRLRNGESLRQICMDADMPSTNVVWYWQQGELGAPATFKTDYARARLDQADAFAAQVMDIADSLDETIRKNVEAAIEGIDDVVERRKAAFFARRRSIEAARLQIDARKWTSGRMHPRNWGDRVALEHSTDPDNPPKLNLSNLTTEQLEKLAQLQAQVDGGGSSNTSDKST